MPISSKDLSSALIELIEENPQKTKELTNNFVKYCREKGMAHKLPSIIRSVEFKNEQNKQKKRIIITAKEKLEEKAIKNIIKMVGGSPGVEIEIKINEDIIGGFVVEYNGTIYDASLRGQMNQIKNKLIFN